MRIAHYILIQYGMDVERATHDRFNLLEDYSHQAAIVCCTHVVVSSPLYTLPLTLLQLAGVCPCVAWWRCVHQYLGDLVPSSEGIDIGACAHGLVAQKMIIPR
eukprot:TRINITY_DN8880_c0_g1_i5.p5 TRINITY_DN8880_c0_g1~~TRINITY_DN8880_c0_g1_i5.p5  ORF type:complete len:103 (+),score=5.45 TRINITY_DN8880_c0_g1_i5:571-879(+)